MRTRNRLVGSPVAMFIMMFVLILFITPSVLSDNTQCTGGGVCTGYSCPSGDNCVIDYNGNGNEYCACQSSNSAGVIAGSVIGAVILVCIIICIIGICIRQRTYYGYYGRPAVVEMQGGRIYSANGGTIISQPVYSPQHYSIPQGIPVGHAVPVMGSPVYGQPQYSLQPQYAPQQHYAQPPPNNPAYQTYTMTPTSPPAYSGQAFKTSDPEFPDVDKTRTGTIVQTPERD